MIDNLLITFDNKLICCSKFYKICKINQYDCISISESEIILISKINLAFESGHFSKGIFSFYDFIFNVAY